jgi:hypothetical protein
LYTFKVSSKFIVPWFVPEILLQLLKKCWKTCVSFNLLAQVSPLLLNISMGLTFHI